MTQILNMYQIKQSIKNLDFDYYCDQSNCDRFVLDTKKHLKELTNDQIKQTIVKSQSFILQNENLLTEKLNLDVDIQQGFTISKFNRRRYPMLVKYSILIKHHKSYLLLAEDYLHRKCNPEINLLNIPSDLLLVLLDNLKLYYILTKVVIVCKKLYDLVYIDIGYLHEHKFILKNPLICKLEDIWEIPSIVKYMQGIHYKKYHVVCITNTLTVVKVKKDVLAKIAIKVNIWDIILL